MTPRWFQVAATVVGVTLAFFFFFARLGSWQNHRLSEIDEAEQAMCRWIQDDASIEDLHDEARDAVRAASADPYVVFFFGVVEALGGERSDFEEEAPLRAAVEAGELDELRDTVDALEAAEALVARRPDLWRRLADRVERQLRNECSWTLEER